MKRTEKNTFKISWTSGNEKKMIVEKMIEQK